MFATPAPSPAVEPQPQPVVSDPALAAPVAPIPVPQPTPASEPTVPLHVLIEERKERQAYQAQLRQFMEAQQRAQQPQPPPIDPVADPEGFARAVVHQNAALAQQMQDMAVHQRANTSEMLARRDPVYGSKVDEAVQEAVKSGLNRHFMAQPDPYKALMDWHISRNVAQQVGPDLSAYRERVRQELIAEMKAGRPVPQNLPPSLSTATKANNAPEVVGEASDFFKSMFSKPQRT